MWYWKHELLLSHPCTERREYVGWKLYHSITLYTEVMVWRRSFPEAHYSKVFPSENTVESKYFNVRCEKTPVNLLWSCLHAQVSSKEGKKFIFCKAQLWITPEIAHGTLQLQATACITLNVKLNVVNSILSFCASAECRNLAIKYNSANTRSDDVRVSDTLQWSNKKMLGFFYIFILRSKYLIGKIFKLCGACQMH